MGEGTAIHEILSVGYRASITKTTLEYWMQSYLCDIITPNLLKKGDILIICA